MMHWMTASEISQGYDAGTLSPVEVVEALLARIDALEPQYRAFIQLDREAALSSAREAERAFKAGRRIGPLHGVPVGIKDIIDIAGQRTSCHSKLMFEHVASEDAPVVAALRASGAILLGKLALHEFAIGGPSFDLPFPPRTQSLEYCASPWRVILGFRDGACGWIFASGTWHGYGWLGTPSCGRLRLGRPQSDV